MSPQMAAYNLHKYPAHKILIQIIIHRYSAEFQIPMAFSTKYSLIVLR
jgi:hypothetical protein